MTDNALVRLAEELRRSGVNALADRQFVHGAGPQIGLAVDGDFFPLWELNQDGNERLLRTRNFEAIRRKRPADWTPAFRYVDYAE